MTLIIFMDIKEEDFLKKEKYGIRHLIECNCILPQYKNMKKPFFHKFPVFSIIDENNNFVERFAQCNNCGIIHKITEIGVSEISSKENIKALMTKEDLKYSLPTDLVKLFEKNDLDISIWEQAEFILENKKWGESIVLSQEIEKDKVFGKILIFQGSPVLFKIKHFERQETIK